MIFQASSWCLFDIRLPQISLRATRVQSALSPRECL